jgi:prepilin-type N-terminal cleavage/methylation domain-containing protein
VIRERLSDKRGTTLLELIIVIAIVAILAGVTASAYHKFIGRAKESAALAILDSVRKTILNLETDTLLWPGLETSDKCKNDGDEYPDLTADNIGLFNNNGNFPGWDGPYLADTFLDASGNFKDPWGMPYFLDCDYRIDGVDFVAVGSFGPNKVGINVYDSDNVYVIVSTN